MDLHLSILYLPHLQLFLYHVGLLFLEFLVYIRFLTNDIVLFVASFLPAKVYLLLGYMLVAMVLTSILHLVLYFLMHGYLTQILLSWLENSNMLRRLILFPL